MNRKGVVPLIIIGAVGIVFLVSFLALVLTRQSAKIPEAGRQVPSTLPALPFATTSLPITSVATSTPYPGKHWESSFTYPYPVSWQEQNITFSLTKVTLGQTVIPPNAYGGAPQPINYNFFDPARVGYQFKVGEPVYALTLYLKISSGAALNQNTQYNVVNMNIRRLLNEQGDFQSPNTRGFTFPSTGGASLRPYETAMDQPVMFFVSPQDTKFELTTGGLTAIFFSVEAKDNGTMEVKQEPKSEGLMPRVNTSSTRVGTLQPPFPSLSRVTPSLPAPLVITLTSPSGPTTVARGDSLPLRWQASGGKQSDYAYFSLFSTSTGQSQTFSPRAYDLYASSRVLVPPGTYTLQNNSPGVYQGYGSHGVYVTVTGLPPTVSLTTSSIDVYDDTVNDGLCPVTIEVYIADNFGYSIRGKKVTLKSDVASDSITPLALYTNQGGEIDFTFKSTTVGTSTLSAYVDGLQIKDTEPVYVLDARDNDCPFTGSGY